MPTKLLMTLGNSPMIVPEVILTYHVPFNEVHIFTSSNRHLSDSALKLAEIFYDHFPEIQLTITAVRDIPIPNSTVIHSLFEEALFQWYLEISKSEYPYVCISGGTRTIPASMQQAARYFGASDVFHLIADMPANENPRNFDDVKVVAFEDRLRIISIGQEIGWPALRLSTSPRHFSASRQDTSIDSLFWKDPSPELPLSRNISFIMQSVQKSSMGEGPSTVPFSMLRLLPPEISDWLKKPLDGKNDSWIQSLPKTDLHCHLGGFATQSPLLEEVIASASDPDSIGSIEVPGIPAGWPLPHAPIPLSDYMHLGDSNGSNLLKDPGCLQKQLELLYDHFLQHNLRYVELRCSPDNYSSSSYTAWEILEVIQDHLQQYMDQAFTNDPDNACHVNVLIIATRKVKGDLSSISRHLALAITAARHRDHRLGICQVVGVDLAGYENIETRPAYFTNDFIGVHRSGLAVTVHAGENDDAESIWQAVHQLHARRIGHGLQLYEARDLMRTMADRRIGVEMCPYANYQIKGFSPMPGREEHKYQLLHYMNKGIPVSVNTDNIGISGATITDNFLLLAKILPGITRLEVLQLVRNGIDTAFWPEALKRELLKIFDTQVLKACLKASL